MISFTLAAGGCVVSRSMRPVEAGVLRICAEMPIFTGSSS